MLIQNYVFHSSCSMVGITVTVYCCKQFWDYYECYQQLAWLCWQIDLICEFCWYTQSQVQNHILVFFLLVHRGISHTRNHFVPWKHQVLVSFLGHQCDRLVSNYIALNADYFCKLVWIIIQWSKTSVNFIYPVSKTHSSSLIPSVLAIYVLLPNGLN